MPRDVDVNEITFGVEIETFIPNVPFAVGGYHNGIQIPDLDVGWNAQSDGSIRPSGEVPPNTRFTGVEVVSPVLKGADGLRSIQKTCNYLNSIGARVNGSCGLHINVGWPYGDGPELKRLVHQFSYYEKALYASTGTKRRERGTFAAPIKDSYFLKRKFTSRSHSEDRYATENVERGSLNIRHVVNPNLRDSKKRVEFRVFAGTTSAKKIIAHVRMSVGMVERALKTRNSQRWEGRLSEKPIKGFKGGEGEKILTRLIRRLGWTRPNHSGVGHCGNIMGEGLPTLADDKKELFRLARKYDDNELQAVATGDVREGGDE